MRIGLDRSGGNLFPLRRRRPQNPRFFFVANNKTPGHLNRCQDVDADPDAEAEELLFDEDPCKQFNVF